MIDGEIMRNSQTTFSIASFKTKKKKKAVTACLFNPSLQQKQLWQIPYSCYYCCKKTFFPIYISFSLSVFLMPVWVGFCALFGV